VQTKVLIVLCAAGLVIAATAPASAQVTRVEPRQSIGFNLGYFAVRGEDSRVEGDVLWEDLSSLAFEVNDFNFVTFGGEYTFDIGEYVEAGVGLGFYQRTVPSVYRSVTHSDGSEIAQDLKLRIIPFTGTVKFLPLGRSASVQPYVGGGIGLFNWRYSETGEFVDFRDDTIFPARYVASGNSAGPVVFGGIRFRASDTWLVGGELKYQHAVGDIDTEGFLGDKIDLTGWTTSFTVNLRF
jgi:outer membrane protein W